MKKAADTITDCLREKGMSQRQLATCMGEDVRNLNQQMNRRNDMKVERFLDVLEHIGYRVEIVDNNGIRKVSDEYAQKIIDEKEPIGLFWEFAGGIYVGIDNTNGGAFCEDFRSKEECFKWLKGEPCVDADGNSHNT